MIARGKEDFERLFLMDAYPQRHWGTPDLGNSVRNPSEKAKKNGLEEL
jgi:hypothetical protein